MKSQVSRNAFPQVLDPLLPLFSFGLRILDRKGSLGLSLFAIFFAHGAFAREFTLKEHAPLRNPIILVHGATIKGSRLQVGPIDLGEYFGGIAPFLETSGTRVKVVELTSDGTIEERAAVLKHFLDTDLKGQEVNLVAHSLGGLDSRWAISVLQTRQVRSLTTIGTPHRGTPLADWAVNQVEGKGFWYWLFRIFGYDMNSRRFLRELTVHSMARFNQMVGDSSMVRYFSVVSGASFGEGNMSYLLWFPARWLEGQDLRIKDGEHDGLVPKESQRWGTQIFYSKNLDHLGQMNHHELRAVSQAEEAYKMYSAIYSQLERDGL